MSRRFKAIRIANALRQTDLADMIGITAPTVRKIENGEKGPISPRTLQLIGEFERKLAGGVDLTTLVKVPR